MQPFTYYRAQSLSDAADKLDEDGQTVLLAGGMSLIPALKAGQVRPAKLIDLAAMSGLGEIMANDRLVSCGAMATHGRIGSHDGVRAKLPAMAEMMAVLGDPAVRARGTIGGALAHGDPAGDYPAAILGLRTKIITRDRENDGDDFFKGPFQTDLGAREIITRIDMAVPQKAAYAKFRHPASRYAMVGVWVSKYEDEVRVGVTGAAPTPFRWKAAEEALAADFSAAMLKDIKPQPVEYAFDMHGSADYRRHLVAVMARRAVQVANGR